MHADGDVSVRLYFCLMYDVNMTKVKLCVAMQCVSYVVNFSHILVIFVCQIIFPRYVCSEYDQNQTICGHAMCIRVCVKLCMHVLLQFGL